MDTLLPETGRYHSIPLENRICELCKMEVEDEKHFICQCPFFTQLQNTFLTCACQILYFVLMTYSAKLRQLRRCIHMQPLYKKLIIYEKIVCYI